MGILEASSQMVAKMSLDNVEVVLGSLQLGSWDLQKVASIWDFVGLGTGSMGID